MKPYFLILGLASLVAVLSGCNSSQASADNTSAAEITTFSNKLNEATMKLAEKEAAAETLRVKSDLQAAELATLTNRVTSLRTELGKQIELVRETQAKLQAQTSQLAQTRDDREALQKTIAQLENELKSARLETENANTNLRQVQAQLSQTEARLNVSEAARAQVLQKWNDTALLRAQLRALNRPARQATGAFMPLHPPKFAVHEDGTIKAVPAGDAGQN